MFGIRKNLAAKIGFAVAAVLVASMLGGSVVLAEASRAPGPEFSHRLVMIRRNLTDDSHVTEIRSIVERSARLGFNGIVLSGGFDGIARHSKEYFDRLRQVKAICDENGMDLIPLGFSVGYAGGVLANDRNLAAALPVKGVPFVVVNGRGVLVHEQPVMIANGGFEEFDGERARGFDLQDGPGVLSRVDTTVRKEGRASLRFENVSKAEGGRGRVMQKVGVHPFRCYKITLWVKTEGLEPSSRFQLTVMTGEGRVLMTWRPSLDPTNDWKEISFGFNSLSYNEVLVYAGVWNGPSGRFWLDDLRAKEVGILNVVRRAGTPVVVKNAVTGVAYEEGRDYQRIEDPALSFRFDHPEPALVALRGGKIREGDRLTLDYYQALELRAGGGQTSVCMSEPRLYDIWSETIRLIHETISPKYYFLAMDEIREGGWCEACVSRGLSAGELLGDCITRQVEIIKRFNPQAEVFVWSDMLDPNHNAKKDYYLFNGDFSGSWNHIPKDVIIACWHYDIRDKSLGHFDQSGFRTMGCGYYDMDSKNAAKDWAASLAKTPGACGIMYTTWKDQYDFLEAFAACTIGDRTGAAGKR